MLTFSLLVFVLLEYETHGETCDDKIESLQNENKIMKAQLYEFQRMTSKMFEFEKMLKGFKQTQTNILDDIDEFRSTQKRQSSSSQVIAFHAYLSNWVSSLGFHHPIRFDTEMTNKGNAYNHYTGTFTVPETGVYVFTWTVVVRETLCATELVLNNSIIGESFPDSEHDADNASATEIVVREAEVGDAVFVRARSGCTSIRSDTVTRSSLVVGNFKS